MWSDEGRERQRAQDLWNARTLTQMRERDAADAMATANAKRNARLNLLDGTLHDMLRSQPDAWGPGGFDSRVAAERCLPIIETLIRA